MLKRLFALFFMLAALGAAADIAFAQGRPGTQLRGARAAAPARAWIGISFRASPDGGISPLVEAVERGAPAAQAGIRAGDRIVSWNGRADVIAAINSTNMRPGETVQVRIRREGQSDQDLAIVAAPRPGEMVRLGRLGPGGGPMTMLRGDSLRIHADSLQSRLRLMLRDSLGTRMGNAAELRAMLENFSRRAPMNMRVFGMGEGVGSALAFGRSGIAGAEFADVTSGLGTYFGTDKGALVLRVGPNTPAARAGLAEGDVIVRAAGQEVESVIDLRRTIAATREDVLLEILRRNERLSVTIER